MQKSIGEFTQGQGISGIANAELENVHISCTTERENQAPSLPMREPRPLRTQAIENPGHHQFQLQEGGVYLVQRGIKIAVKVCGIIVERNHFLPSVQKEEKNPKYPLNPKKESHCSSSDIAFCY